MRNPVVERLVAMSISRGAGHYETMATARRVLDDLTDAGWHLVSTPEVTERDERPLGEAPMQLRGLRLFEAQVVVDDRILSLGRSAHPIMLDEPEYADYMRAEVGRDLAHALGDHLGLPGCAPPPRPGFATGGIVR